MVAAVTPSAVGADPGAGRAVEAAGLSRAELFAGLCVLGFANGIARRVYESIVGEGAISAFAGAFGISAVVWVAFVVCPAVLLRAPREPFGRMDAIVAACALVGFVLPLGAASWVALTGLALYLLRDAFTGRRRPSSPLHRGAWILLATTGAMFWGRLLLSSASGPVLGADALLVGWFAGTETVGNTVRFADGAGYVWIAPACSSLANISLAILCWTLFAQSRGLGWSWGSIGWCVLACLCVVAVNVARIGLMVLYREHFDLIHGPTGAAVASWISVALVLGVCWYGTRRGRLARV